MKKIYVIAVLLLVATLVMTAAIPKPGPMVVLTLRNRMLTQEAHVALSGLTAYYTYYLTARAWDVDVKYPQSLSNLIVGKEKDTKYQIRSDFYEGTIYACGGNRSGVFNFTKSTRLVFPLCYKTARNMGEPRQEKVSPVRGWPGYWDPAGATRYTCTGGSLAWQGGTKEADRKGTKPWCSEGVPWNYNRGDSYSDGDVDGNFLQSKNGAQIRWAIDFYNWDNKGTDYWH